MQLSHTHSIHNKLSQQYWLSISLLSLSFFILTGSELNSAESNTNNFKQCIFFTTHVVRTPLLPSLRHWWQLVSMNEFVFFLSLISLWLCLSLQHFPKYNFFPEFTASLYIFEWSILFYLFSSVWIKTLNKNLDEQFQSASLKFTLVGLWH